MTSKITHKFWDTQPISTLATDSSINDNNQQVTLPDDFMWAEVNLADDKQIVEVVSFLNKHYCQDVNNAFRVNMTVEFMQWVFKNTHDKSYCLSMRVKKSNLMVGFISAYPTTVQLGRNIVKTAEVNFLCIHKKIRDKNVAPMLIKQLIHECSKKNYKHAYFTSDKLFAEPFFKCQYYHRALNINLLIETGFMNLKQDNKLNDVEKILSLPTETVNNNKIFQPLQEEDINASYDVLMTYFKKYSFYPLFDKEEFKKVFFGNKIVTTYVLKDADHNIVLDVISYYHSRLASLKTGKIINQAHLYYYSSLHETPFRLIKDMMIVAKSNNMDVFTAYNIMENSNILKELHFEPGTCILNNYLYNLDCKQLNNSQVAKIPV